VPKAHRYTQRLNVTHTGCSSNNARNRCSGPSRWGFLIIYLLIFTNPLTRNKSYKHWHYTMRTGSSSRRRHNNRNTTMTDHSNLHSFDPASAATTWRCYIFHSRQCRLNSFIGYQNFIIFCSCAVPLEFLLVSSESSHSKMTDSTDICLLLSKEHKT
jgi:hypothetical protein